MVKKTARRKKLTHSRLGLGLVALGFLVAVVIIGKLVQIGISLNLPMSPGSPSEEKTSHFDGSGQFNVIVSAGSNFLISYDSSQKSASVVQIPEDTYLDLPFQFGRWPVSSIYKLGQAENPPMGGLLLKNALSNALGLPIDGYMVFDQGQKDTKTVVDSVRSSLMGGFFPFREGRTDLSRLEYWHFIRGLKSVRNDKINYFSFGDEDVTQPVTLPDGSQAQSFDSLELDSFIQKNLTNSSLKAEELTVGVFNATDHPGLAEKAGRVVSNMGGRVVLTVSIPARLEYSLVTGKDSYSKQYISNVFATACNKKLSFLLFSRSSNTCQIADSTLNQSRADVNVILGEDYFLRYNSR